MSADGTYQDPVGMSVIMPPVLSYLRAGDLFLAADWLSAAKLALMSATDTTDLPIRVGGHAMTGSNGIINRKITATAPTNIRVEWP